MPVTDDIYRRSEYRGTETGQRLFVVLSALESMRHGGTADQVCQQIKDTTPHTYSLGRVRRALWDLAGLHLVAAEDTGCRIVWSKI